MYPSASVYLYHMVQGTVSATVARTFLGRLQKFLICSGMHDLLSFRGRRICPVQFNHAVPLRVSPQQEGTARIRLITAAVTYTEVAHSKFLTPPPQILTKQQSINSVLLRKGKKVGTTQGTCKSHCLMNT